MTIRLVLLPFLLFSLVTLHAAALRPNVVIFLVDDLGWSDVRCLNNGTVKTPNIDRITQDGAIFIRHG
jgi:arylsulfatase A-like enzyme